MRIVYIFVVILLVITISCNVYGEIIDNNINDGDNFAIESTDHIIRDNTCGDHLTWSYNTDTYTLTIQGTGDMGNFSSLNVPWSSYKNKMRKVIIEEGVTSIGTFAFGECDKLTSVEIPSTITSIGNSAFKECESLISVTIPFSVRIIGFRAFYWCSNLETVIIHPGVTKIDGNAFTYCESLTSITIPSTVTELGESVFERCKKVRKC